MKTSALEVGGSRERNVARGCSPSNPLSQGKKDKVVTVKTSGDDVVMGSETDRHRMSRWHRSLW